MSSVDHTGLLRRSPRCSVITQRARVQQRPSQRPPPFLHVPPRALWLECGPVEKKKRPPPSRQRATWLAACRRREKRPSSSTRQANKVGEDVAKGLSHLILVRSVTGEPRRRLEHKIALHKAASEVRYIVIFNNGSPTEPNGVSELSLAPHRVTMLTTKHSPAEIARKKSRVGVECSPVSCSTAACSR